MAPTPSSRLTRLLQLDDTLSAWLCAHETHDHDTTTRRATVKAPPLPHGYKLLGKERDEAHDSPEAARQAFAQYVLWQTYLAHAGPTRRSAFRALQRIRAWLVWRAARVRHAAGQPLPLSPLWPAHKAVPSWALERPRKGTKARTNLPVLSRRSKPNSPHTRVAGDNEPFDLSETIISDADAQAIWDALLRDQQSFWQTLQSWFPQMVPDDAMTSEDVQALFAELDADPLAFMLKYGGAEIAAQQAGANRAEVAIFRVLGDALDLTSPEDFASLLAALRQVAIATASDPIALDALEPDALAFWEGAGSIGSLTPEEIAAGAGILPPGVTLTPGQQQQQDEQAQQQQELSADRAALLDSLGQVLETAGQSILMPPADLGDLEGAAAQDWLLSDPQVLQLLNAQWASQAGTLAGAEVLDDAGVPGAIVSSWTLDDPVAMDYLRQQAGLLVTNIDETTRAQLADVLWGGYSGYLTPDDMGLPLDRLARLIQDTMRETPLWDTLAFTPDGLNGISLEVSRARAMLIARTETARATSFGTMIAYSQMGVRFKLWIVNAGACQICVGNAEAGAIPLAQDFPSGVKAPPTHPLDRCAISAVVPSEYDPTALDESAFGPSNYAPMLFDPAYGLFPKVSWPEDASLETELPDIDLSDVEASAAPQVTRRRTRPTRPRDLGLLGEDTLPPAMRDALRTDPTRLTTLGQMLARRVEALALAQAQVAGVPTPQRDADLKALAKAGKQAPDLGTQTSDFLGQLRQAVRQTIADWRAQLQAVEG